MCTWNNKWSDTSAKIDMFGEDLFLGPPFVSTHVANNRDYYNAVSAQSSATSSFNGATGMGFGTLANRPTTCTTNALEKGGWCWAISSPIRIRYRAEI